MIGYDILNFQIPFFLLEREVFSQSLQLSGNQTIELLGTSYNSCDKLNSVYVTGVLSF